jgi:hypothetical protein
MKELERKLELALALLKSPDTRQATWHMAIAETLGQIKELIEKQGI